MDKARAYQLRIQEAIAKTRAGLLRDRLRTATQRLGEWLAHLERLTTRLNEFDRAAARQTLAARQTQLDYLTQLDQVMQQTELRCEQTVAELGTLYSQVLLVDAKDVNGSRAQRIQADIDEQIQSLHDLLNAMAEIQSQRAEKLT